LWDAGFEVLGEVRSILVQLEEIGDEETIDWKIIIGDHLYFEPMSSAEFPPLYNEQDFENTFLERVPCDYRRTRWVRNGGSVI
jgi:hypothetical protein